MSLVKRAFIQSSDSCGVLVLQWERWRAVGLCGLAHGHVSGAPGRFTESLGLILISSYKRHCTCLLDQLSKQGYLLPVNAIHRAYFVASLRQWEATSKPHVTVKEMIPMMIKNRVVTHSGGSRGGMQVRSRPWMVWHCRTRPTVSAPGKMQRWNTLVSLDTQEYSHKISGVM